MTGSPSVETLGMGAGVAVAPASLVFAPPPHAANHGRPIEAAMA